MQQARIQHFVIALLLGATVLLSGCAGVPVVDSSVQSYAAPGAAPGAGARYRFERLPLQQNDPVRQQALEQLAEPALARVGLVHDDAAARYSVQLGASVGMYYPYVPVPWTVYPGSGLGFGWARGGWGVGFDYGWPPPQPVYHHEVSLVMRDNANGGRVVYQTGAVNDSGWWNNDAVLRAMFAAALEGFPTPPAGVRRVGVRLASD